MNDKCKFTNMANLTIDEAREQLEKLRWPNGPACPHCGGLNPYKITGRPDSKRPARKGLYKCKECRSQFTVTVGTIFEDSHIPLNKWLMAISLLCASKKGMSAHQLHRMLGMTYKSAWFMAHRIRYAMQQGPLAEKLTGTIEVDETYVGGKPRKPIKQRVFGEKFYTGRGTKKIPVVALVQRDGTVRSQVMRRLTGRNLRHFVYQNVKKGSHIMTDEFPRYKKLGRYFNHQTVNHGINEYVRGDVHTNTIEGFFGLLKRGINGIYHHVSPVHLPLYLTEFDYRYNMRKVEDDARTRNVFSGIEGKRLLYRKPLRAEEEMAQNRLSY
jgi:transposase-like protein